MIKHASGTFEVKLNPQPWEDNVGDATKGLAGQMKINIVEGKQTYELEYTLAAVSGESD